MSNRLVVLVAGCVLLVAALQAPARAGAARPGAVDAALKIAPVAYRERRLGNGLQVLSVQSRTSPTVSVQVWYRVGSRDDPAGRSGFAHLFEHLMFKGTEYQKGEQFDRLTEDVGGNNNAFTSEDVTAYQSVVPSNYLETILWAEADRMANLRVDEAAFRSERAVVGEEYRERVLASPYGRFFNAVTSAPYLDHPYQRPTIGSLPELEAATLADVQAFHRRHYRPDTATLVVAGDFEPAQLDAWVDKYFGVVVRPAVAAARAEPAEPAWAGDRRLRIAGPSVPLPAVAVAWLAPPLASADAPALQVAAGVLSAGESSRLNQALVYRQRIAGQAGFEANLRDGPGLLVAYAIAAGSKSIDSVEAALRAEVQRLINMPPTAAELAKVKTQIVTQATVSRQTPLGLAEALGQAAVLEKDPARINTSLDALQKVSAADVQRVLRRYVQGARSVTLDYAQDAAAK